MGLLQYELHYVANEFGYFYYTMYGLLFNMPSSFSLFRIFFVIATLYYLYWLF